MKKKEKKKTLQIENRQARFKFHIEDTYEAGMELRGSEVKSIRQGQISLNEGYGFVKDGQAYLSNVYITPYETTNTFDQPESLRNIRLLLHKKEILKIQDRIQKERFTLVPLKLYAKQNKIKILMGLAKGKKLFDKRESKKKQDIERNILKKYKTAR